MKFYRFWLQFSGQNREKSVLGRSWEMFHFRAAFWTYFFRFFVNFWCPRAPQGGPKILGPTTFLIIFASWERLGGPNLVLHRFLSIFDRFFIICWVEIRYVFNIFRTYFQRYFIVFLLGFLHIRVSILFISCPLLALTR